MSGSEEENKMAVGKINNENPASGSGQGLNVLTQKR